MSSPSITNYIILSKWPKPTRTIDLQVTSKHSSSVKLYFVTCTLVCLFRLDRNRLPNTTGIFALNGSLLEWTSIELLPSHIPIHHGTQHDECHEHNCIVHGLTSHRSGRREEEDNRSECGPDHGPEVNGSGEFTHVPWARLEAVPEKFAHNGDHVGPVKRDGGDVEDTLNSGVATETDQVDGNAPEDGDPHSIQRGTSRCVHFAPNKGEGQEAITGEGEDGTAKSLGGSEADELQQDKGANGVNETSRFAETVVEDLRHGLFHGGCEDGSYIAHAETEDDIEQESENIDGAHGKEDGPGSFDFGIEDST